MPTACYGPTGNLLGLKRSIWEIYQDLNALPTAQKDAVWADITSGDPPKWSLAEGPDAGAVAALSVQALDVPVSDAFPTAVRDAARMKMLAAYVRDTPTYLVNPAFDPSINVPGFVPA